MYSIELNDDQQQHSYAASFVEAFMERISSVLPSSVVDTIYLHTRFLGNNSLMVVSIRTKLFIDIDVADCELLSIESMPRGITSPLGKWEWLVDSVDKYISPGVHTLLPCKEAEAVIKFYELLGLHINEVYKSGIITGFLQTAAVSFAVERALITILPRPNCILRRANQLNAMYLKAEELGIPFN